MNKTSLLSRNTIKWQRVGAALSAGLFGGRIVSEILRPGIPGAILITLASVLLTLFILGKYDFQRTWPTYLLLLYVFYPEPDLRVAALVGFLVLLTYIITFGTAVSDKAKTQAITIIIALAIGFLFLLLYWGTLSRDVLPADSGEFQLIAAELGVAHPPGFPLYTVAANLFSRLPFGQTPAYRVNLLSAFTSAAALIFVFLTVKELTGTILGGVIAAGALGTAATFWAQATTANIRSLTAFFAAAAFYAFVMLRLKGMEQSNKDDVVNESGEAAVKSPSLSLLILFFLAVALGISHHPSLIFIAVLLLSGVLIIWPSLLKTSRFWLVVGLSSIIALLPLLYLPLRASSGAIGAPEDLDTFQGFIKHVLALGFRGDFFYFLEPALLWERMNVMVNVMTFQFSPYLLVGMFVGFVLLFKRDRFLALLIGGSFLLHTLISAVYRAPQTVEYMMPAYIPAVLLLGYGAGIAAKYAGVRSKNRRFDLPSALSAVYVSALLIAVLIQFTDRYRSFSYLHNDASTRDYLQAIIDEAPVNSVVLADWHWATPMWYLQEVENQRPDLDIHFVFPTDEPYGETWARRIGEELANGRPVVATHYDEGAYGSLPPSTPVGEAFYFGPDRTKLLENFIQLDILLGDKIQLLGYQLNEQSIQLGEEFVLTLAWKSLSDNVDLSNLFAHIINGEGVLLAFDDQTVQQIQEGINLTQLRMSPRPGTVPGKYPLLVGAYGGEPLADKSGQPRTSITEVQIKSALFRPYTANAVYRDLDTENGNRRLIGYDWDNTLRDRPRLYIHWQNEEGYYSETIDPKDGQVTLPNYIGPWGISLKNQIIENEDKETHYVPFGQGIVWIGRPVDPELAPSPGDQVVLKQKFVSARPVNRDLIVSLRLVGFEEDGFHWAWWDLDDGVPAMGAIPTLKWIAGSGIQDPHWATVGETAEPGQIISPLLRIYDAFTGRVVPILDERISQQFPWVGLGKARLVR